MPFASVYWTKEKIDLLIENYERKDIEDIKRLFPDLTWKQIWTKAHKFGLKRKNIYGNGKRIKKILSFKNIDTEKKSYCLGFLAADGCVYHPVGKRSLVMTIKLAEKDKSHLIKLKNLISPQSNICYTKDHMVWFSVGNQKLGEQLIKQGIVPNKTFILEPPENLQVDLIPHYIRGYVDGDGSIFVSKGRLHCIIAAASDPILLFIKNEFWKKHKNNVNITQTRTCRVLHYGEGTAKAFLNFIYKDATIYMDRKYEIARPYLNV